MGRGRIFGFPLPLLGTCSMAVASNGVTVTKLPKKNFLTSPLCSMLKRVREVSESSTPPGNVQHGNGHLFDRSLVRSHSEAPPSLRMGWNAWKCQSHSVLGTLVPRHTLHMGFPLPIVKGKPILNMSLGTISITSAGLFLPLLHSQPKAGTFQAILVMAQVGPDGSHPGISGCHLLEPGSACPSHP